jgi:LPS-assembly lipoprotein
MLTDDVEIRSWNQARRMTDTAAPEPLRIRIFRSLCTTAVVTSIGLLAACGFRLAGTGTLPAVMATTYVETTERNSEFFESMREALRLRGLEIVDVPEKAGARLIIIEDSTGQRVLSVSARNTPREYEIFYAVTFALQAGPDNLIESESLVVTRSYTYDETQVLGKSREERVLRQALADDLARQVVRRIEALTDASSAPVG